MSRSTRAGAVLLGLVLASCSPARPPSVLPGAIDPASLLETVRRRQDRIKALRATFTAQVTNAGDGGRSVKGVLVARKPRHFRLRLMMPFGLSVFDYLDAGGEIRTTFPLRKDDAAARSAEELGPAFGDELRRLLLRDDDARCSAGRASAGEVIAECRSPSGVLVRRMRLDSRTGWVLEERSYRGGALTAVFRFADYKSVGEADLPHSITLTPPSTDLVVEVRVDRYEVNPVLGDELFRPVRR